MNTAVSRNDWVGRVIDGRFPLLEWLGNTKQAGVFRTELEGPGAKRAVIRLLPVDQEAADARLRVWQAIANLSHPHLMRIFESGRAKLGGVDLLYVVTEYAEESLAQVIPERPLSSGEAREMLRPILDALSYLHAQGLTHGHIKPSNIMVAEDRVKLPVESVQRADDFRGPGKPLQIYDAPEIASGVMSPASDIWSVGATLVEALTQNPPRWDLSANKEPVVSSEISRPFAEIARASLRYDPARRASLQEIRTLLKSERSAQEPANEFDPIAPAEAAGQPHSAGEGVQTRRRMAVIGAAIIMALLVIVFFALRSHKSEPSSPVAQSPATSATPVPPVTPAPARPSASPPPASNGLTSKGAIAQRVMPDVLASANRTIRGKVEVRVRVDVDANGAVSDARYDVHGSSRYFAAKALDAARRWTFKPAETNGHPIPSVWNLRFEFRRSGPEVSAEEVTP